jgi:DNA-binding SARP family transcriptional activator
MRAWYGDRLIDLGPVRQQTLAAVLVLNANRVLTADDLLAAAWDDEEAPSTGAKVIAPYIYRIRRLLPDPGLLRRCRLGYSLELGPERLDVSEFETLAGTARVARRAGDLEFAQATFDKALSLFQGDPLGGMLGRYLAARRGRFVELRHIVLSERIEVALQLGRHEDVIADLTALVAEAPLDERFAKHLMLALCLDGRQSLALQVYRRTRTHLVEQLGIEPGPALRETHRSILTDDYDHLLRPA